MTGARALADYTDAMMHVVCHKSDSRGQYRRSSPIALYGEKVALPNALAQLAHDCRKRAAIGDDTCGADFPHLMERARK